MPVAVGGFNFHQVEVMIASRFGRLFLLQVRVCIAQKTRVPIEKKHLDDGFASCATCCVCHRYSTLNQYSSTESSYGTSY